MPAVKESQCKICNSPARKEIERLLMTEGKTYREIVAYCRIKEVNINIANLSTHKNKHMLLNTDTLKEISKTATSLPGAIDVRQLTPEELLDYVAQEAVNGIASLKLLPVSHYTLGARNNFLSTIRQIAETKMKAAGTLKDEKDITQLINDQLKQRGLMVDVTPKKE